MSLQILIYQCRVIGRIFQTYIHLNLDDLVNWCGISVFIDPELDPNEAREIRSRTERHLALESIELEDYVRNFALLRE